MARWKPPIEERVDAYGRPVRVGDVVKVTCSTYATEGFPCKGVITSWTGYGVAEVKGTAPGEAKPGLYDVPSSYIERVIKRGPGAKRGRGRGRVQTRRRSR